MSRSRNVAVRHRLAHLITVILAAFLAAFPSSASAAPCWNPAVRGRVVDPFRMPACTWCPGNRGIEYDVHPGTAVRSVAPGSVEFSGFVAGERYVVVRLTNGWQITYGRVTSSAVEAGQSVLAGSVIGVADDDFLFGLRVDGEYADPAPYLGTPTGRRRLVPTDGRPARAAPAAAPRCVPVS
jgi:murein DD-endopeptidase MepM/ murein hydrolase activator NlpD